MLHFILGSSGAGKTHTLYQHVLEQSMLHKELEYLILVPEQFTLQVQKDITFLHERQGIMNIDVLSFLRLAFRIFEETGKEDRVILDDAGKSLIVKKAALAKQKELKIFGNYVKKKGFIAEMKSLISEFYQYAIDQEEFERMLLAAKEKPLLHAKLLDIKVVYEAFQEFLQEKYITNEEIFDVLGRRLAESELIRKCTVYLDGYTGFTPSQYKLIRRILRYAREVYVAVTIDRASYYEPQQEHMLFHNSAVTIERLRQIAMEEQIAATELFCGEMDPPYRFRKAKALAHLERNLYRQEPEYQEEQQEIFLYEAESREEECRRAALAIRKLVNEEQYRYKDIAVISADINVYGPVFRRIFKRMQIPCFVDQKETILSNPLSELIRAILTVVRYDFTYDSVMYLLKTGLLDWKKEEIDKLENYVIAMGIKGKYRWNMEWKKKYHSSYELSLEELNAYRIKLYQMVEPVWSSLTNPSAAVNDWLEALYLFLRNQRIEEKLVHFAEEKREDKLLAKEYEQVYRLVMELFDRISALLGEDCLSLLEFYEIMETGLSEIQVGFIPPGTDQVVIGDIERTRLKDIQALFFVGVNDGLVPKLMEGGGVLSDSDRQFFLEHEIILAPTLRQNAYLSEYYLYLNLTKPQRKLYLSYYKLDDGGKTAYPSSLLTKLRRLFPKLRPVKEDIGILSIDEGMGYLSDTLRSYRDTPPEEPFFALYQLYRKDQARHETLEKLIEAAFYQRAETGISKRTAVLLYGNTLLGSVTRMEQYASCAFAHFMTYGLSLEERKEYIVSMPDIGNIYHLALEYFSEKLREDGLFWHGLLEEDRIRILKESVETACLDYHNGILESSRRNAYLVKKVERVLNRTTKIMKEQLSSGLFEPYAYEKSFLYSDQFLSLRGRIDRIDLYEEEDRLYVQIIDYKSGSRAFDLESLYYGLQLQLGVYLDAGLGIVKKEKADKTALPAGIFYYNIEDPVIEKTNETEEEIEAEIKKKLILNGLANADSRILKALDRSFWEEGEGLRPMVKSSVIPVETNKAGDLTKRSSTAGSRQFEVLLSYVNQKMHEMSAEIMEGSTKLNPYKMKDKTACDYCGYSSACRFDAKLSGNFYHKLSKLGADEVWNKIGGKNGLDGAAGTGDTDKKL